MVISSTSTASDFALFVAHLQEECGTKAQEEEYDPKAPEEECVLSQRPAVGPPSHHAFTCPEWDTLENPKHDQSFMWTAPVVLSESTHRFTTQSKNTEGSEEKNGMGMYTTLLCERLASALAACESQLCPDGPCEDQWLEEIAMSSTLSGKDGQYEYIHDKEDKHGTYAVEPNELSSQDVNKEQGGTPERGVTSLAHIEIDKAKSDPQWLVIENLKVLRA